MGPLIGVRTGHLNGFSLVDVEPRRNGNHWYEQHRNQLPLTRIHQTQSDGLHLLYRYAPELRNTTDELASGVETLNDNRCAIWWPAAGYKILVDAPLAPFPQFILDELMRPSREAKEDGPLLPERNGPLLQSRGLEGRTLIPKDLYFAVREMVPLSDKVTRHHQRRVNVILSIVTPGLTLIIVHHTRKGDLIYRGPGVLAGDSDNIIYVERVRKELRANVICEFSRNAAEFEDFSFTLVPEQVRTKNGLKPFLVVDELVEAVGTVGEKTDKAKRQRELDELAHRVLVGEYEGPESWTESVAWFELTKAQRGELGLGTTTFSNCRKRLLAKRMIRMWETAKNKFYQAVIDGREAAPERPSGARPSSSHAERSDAERSQAAPEGPSTPSTPSTLTPRLYRRGVQELRSDPGSARRSSGVVSSQSGNGHSQESPVAPVPDKAAQALERLLNKKPPGGV